MKRRTAGFTILELMIVVAIIAIVAAIALPSLTKARQSGLEAKVVQTLRTIVTANEQYRTRFGTYAGILDDLGDSRMVPQFNAGVDYFPEYGAAYNGAAFRWNMTVWPISFGITGDRSFYVDSTGVIRWDAVNMAGPGSTPLD